MFSINDKFIVTVTLVNNKIVGRSILDVRLCGSLSRDWVIACSTALIHASPIHPNQVSQSDSSLSRRRGRGVLIREGALISKNAVEGGRLFESLRYSLYTCYKILYVKSKTLIYFLNQWLKLDKLKIQIKKIFFFILAQALLIHWQSGSVCILWNSKEDTRLTWRLISISAAFFRPYVYARSAQNT